MHRFRPTPLRVAAVLTAVALSAGIGVASAASLGVGSGNLWAGRQSLAKGTCNQTSSTGSDTWVDQSNPTQANGSGTLSVQSSNKAEQDAYVRFDLSGCGIPTSGGADSAVLTVVVTSATRTNHTISVYPVYSSWSDSSLTWNGAASLSVGSASGSFATTTGTHTIAVTGDVDAAIKSGRLWGWKLVDSGSGNATTTIASMEDANPPSLSLSYEK